MGIARFATRELSEREILGVAERYLRERIGSVPNAGRPRREGKDWVVPVDVRYPRVVFDYDAKRADKVMFINFPEILRLRFAPNGELVEKFTVPEYNTALSTKLDELQGSVRKALVRTEARRFSTLPFPEHMHTPIVDIISWIVLRGPLPKSELMKLVDEELPKYEKHLRNLEAVGLVRQTEEAFLPGNALVLIQEHAKTDHQRVEEAMAFFFEQGYSFLDTVKAVLGPHIILTGHIYESAFEAGFPISLPLEELKDFVAAEYYEVKRTFQLPRYLIQLERAGLVARDLRHMEPAYQASDGVLKSVRRADDLLEPLWSAIHPPGFMA